MVTIENLNIENKVAIIENPIRVYDLYINFPDVLDKYQKLFEAVKAGKVESAYAITFGGIIEAVSKMAFGNKLGVELKEKLTAKQLVSKDYGSIIVEMDFLFLKSSRSFEI